MDVESTGLEVSDLLLELAVIVTDADLGDLGVYHRLVDQPPTHVHACQATSPDVRQMHVTSGLTRELATADAAASPERIDTEICAFPPASTSTMARARKAAVDRHQGLEGAPGRLRAPGRRHRRERRPSWLTTPPPTEDVMGHPTSCEATTASST